MVERDRQDMSRAVAPLKQAEDAVLLDTSKMTLDESIEAVLQIIRKKIEDCLLYTSNLSGGARAVQDPSHPAGRRGRRC